MDVQRSLNTMPVQAFVEPTEWMAFSDEIQTIAQEFPGTNGVLGIGSLIQSFRPPTNYFDTRHPGPLGIAYELIRNPQRRKVFPGSNSDLDIWVSVQDTSVSAEMEDRANTAGIALLEELTNGSVQRGTEQWLRKKNAAFSEFYKNPDLYDSGFMAANEDGPPWMAERFKFMLERALLNVAPDFVRTVSEYTERTVPGSFLEVRAFPESLFHLRPDDNLLSDGIEDRQPFPRIADDQWISPSHASHIFYSNGETSIYPFKPGGRVLGKAISDHIRSSAPDNGLTAHGAMLIKPDAIEAGQVGVVMSKLHQAMPGFGGRIVTEKLFDGLTYEQVRTIYPSLSGQDLVDTSRYLASGHSIGLVVEASIEQEKLTRELDAIKGPRIADRTEERLLEGRYEEGSIRDLLPLPGDEDRYRELIPAVFRRKADPTHKFSDEQYAYYSRNLVHSPDNRLELTGLLQVIGYRIQ